MDTVGTISGSARSVISRFVPVVLFTTITIHTTSGTMDHCSLFGTPFVAQTSRSKTTRKEGRLLN